MIALTGLGILVATALLLWRVLPRNGKVHSIVGTPMEPYFAILFVSGAAFGIGLIAVGAVQHL